MFAINLPESITPICAHCSQPVGRRVTIWNKGRGTEEYSPSTICVRCAAVGGYPLPCSPEYKCRHSVYLPSWASPAFNPVCYCCRFEDYGSRCQQCGKTAELIEFRARDLFLSGEEKAKDKIHRVDQYRTDLVCVHCKASAEEQIGLLKLINWQIKHLSLFDELSQNRIHFGRKFTNRDLARECFARATRPQTLETIRNLESGKSDYIAALCRTVQLSMMEDEDRNFRFLVVQDPDTGDEVELPFADEPANTMCGGPTTWGFELVCLTRHLPKLKVLSIEERSIWEQVHFEDKKFREIEAKYTKGRKVGNTISKTQVYELYLRADAVIRPHLHEWFSDWNALANHLPVHPTPKAVDPRKHDGPVYWYNGEAYPHGQSAGLIDGNGGRRTVRFSRFGNVNRPAYADRLVTSYQNLEWDSRIWEFVPANQPAIKKSKSCASGELCVDAIPVDKYYVELATADREKPYRLMPALAQEDSDYCYYCAAAIPTISEVSASTSNTAANFFKTQIVRENLRTEVPMHA